jgi:hypothetical protein
LLWLLASAGGFSFLAANICLRYHASFSFISFACACGAKDNLRRSPSIGHAKRPPFQTRGKTRGQFRPCMACPDGPGRY